ncbi:MAG: hypothetical protein JXQ29_12985 [Planctomycetes bacterium]|nr:hypothetical protein [Planctomycetota bacterium]
MRKSTRRCLGQVAVLTAVLMGTLALAGPAPGQDKFPYVGVIAEDRVHIRGDGGKNHYIMATVDKGEMVEVYGRGGAKDEWLKCLYPKPLCAYITTKYVKKVDDQTGVLEAQNVLLRPAPTVKQYPLRTLPPGTRLRITGEKEGFYEVVMPADTFVWIHQDYVRYFGPLEQYGPELKKIREEAMKAFLAARPAPAGPEIPGAAAPAAPKPEEAAEPGAGEAVVQAREALLVRLAALHQRYEKHEAAKDLEGLQGVEEDLARLEEEAVALSDDASRYMVSYRAGQLVTKVKLATLDAQDARKARERQPLPDELRPVKGTIEITGWVKKYSQPFVERVIYKLEKGSVVLYFLRAERYDLDRFVNKHVSVTGRIPERKSPMDNDYLEVLRLKVLSQ